MKTQPTQLDRIEGGLQQLTNLVLSMREAQIDHGKRLAVLEQAYNALRGLPAAVAELRELVVAGFDTMNARFDRLEARVDKLELRMNGLELRMTEQESAQRETNRRLIQIEGHNKAHYNDIKALYRGLELLNKKYQSRIAADLTLQRRVGRIEAFARKLAIKTGIPFKASA